MRGLMKRAAVERMTGNKPSPPRAMLVASAAGAAAAVLTYRVLRA
jgi:hypothetical protein